MSLLGIARPSGRHRAVDEVTRLRQQLLALALLTASLYRRLAQATAARDAANAKASRLSEIEEYAAEVTRERNRLRAALANATSVHVAAGVRNISPGDEPTQPIPLARPLWGAPFATTNPGRLPD